MNPADASRYAALAIGAFQVLANGASLVRGLARLPGELRSEGATARIADLARAAWVYGTLGNLCIATVLLLVASGLRAGEPLARQVAVAIGIYYLALGAGTYAFAERRHPGLLVFSALGVALLVALWFSR
jgi:hypothetical protein